MPTIAELNTLIDDVRDTSSGLVEWNNNSLNAVTVKESELIQYRGVYQVADTSAMSAVSALETRMCAIASFGTFIYLSSGTPNGSTRFAAAGGGIWELLSYAGFPAQTLTALTDVSITGTPNDGDVLTYNSSSSKWENAAATALEWANILNTPTTLAGYGITDKIVRQQATTSNISFNGATPLQASGSANVVFGDVALPAFTTGSYNIVAAPRALSDFKQGSNSVVLTPRTALHAATTGTQAVDHCTIIGDCGALDDIYASNSLTNILAIGMNGSQQITVDNTGQMHFKYNAGQTDASDYIFNGSVFTSSALSVTTGLTVGTSATIGTTLGVTGATTLSSTLAVTGNATLGGAVEITGATTIAGAVVINAALTAGDMTAKGDINFDPGKKFSMYNGITVNTFAFRETTTTTGLTLKTTEYWTVAVNGSLKKVALVN